MSNDVILGIDLGTIDSCAAIYRNNGFETVPDSNGNNIIASMVCYKEDNDIFLYGQTARDNSLEYAATTMFESKRFIGNKFKYKSVQNDIKHLPVKIIEDKNTGKPKYEIKQKSGIKEYFPEEVSSMILKYIKNYCDVFRGNNSEIKKTIITVPAQFKKWQREATIQAGKDAGLQNIELLNEATAAAIAYGDKFKANKEMKILIFDIGGGTFDVSILKVEGNEFTVLSSYGISHLGGEDFNQLLLDYIGEKLKEQEKFKDIKFYDPDILIRFVEEVENKKKELSEFNEVDIFIANLKGNENFCLTITRKKYEELCKSKWDEMFVAVKKALEIAKIDKTQLDNVIFVGGPTRTPKIEEMAKNFFGKVEILKNVNVEEVVAHGAAISAHKNYIIKDTISNSIGIEIKNRLASVIIPMGTNLPITKPETYVRKYILEDDTNDMNESSQKTVLTHSNQTTQKIRIFEGNSQNISENKTIGEFILSLDENEKEITIKMKIDYNLNLTVYAVVNNKIKEEKIIKMDLL